MTETTAPLQVGRYSAADAVRPVLAVQTYENLLYLTLAFPLGLVYWTMLLFGFVFGLALSILAVGIAILAATVVGSRYLAGFERWLANALLECEIRTPTDRPPGDGIWSTVRGYFEASSTWRGLGFLLVKFWIGVAGFLLLAFLWNAVELASAPLQYPYAVEFGTLNDQPIAWTVTTLPEAAVAAPAGLLLALVFLHAANGLAHISGRIATALLGATGGPDES